MPTYIRFGDEVYRDRVDISNTQFYRKLAASFVHPVTSAPTPQDFAQVYSDCSKEVDGIISVHISARLSNTHSSALHGKKMTKGKCHIEVIDSHLGSIGLGLVAMAAAKLARTGANLQSVLDETRKAISEVRMIGIFDTMKYLVLGGRVSRATAAVASIFKIKPLLTFRNGEVVREGLVRTYPMGMDRLYRFAEDYPGIQDLAIAHSTVPEKAGQLKARLGSIYPEDKIYVAQLGATMGVHSGPGALILALRRAK